MKISFCLITLNEEANLPRCLQSLQDLADELVIVDSGSADQTRSIAERHGALWHPQPWLGYVGQKNLACSLASHEWVFSIDADEALSPGLQLELRTLKTWDIPESCSGFSMPRCVLYDGRWIRHGDWYPDRLVRLFRRDRARFAGGRVHERLEVSGGITPLSGEIEHHSFRDAADHRARGRHYARLWAESAFEQGRRVRPGSALCHAAFRWVRGYLLRGGFLDGRQGWIIAWINAAEVRLKYRHLGELQRRGRTP